MPRIRNPCSYLPRRLQIVACLTGFVLFAILFLGSSSPADPILEFVPYGPELERGAHEVLEHVPYAEQLNPFGARVHKPPPEQKNSSNGDVRWFTDFKWRNPFSSSTTLDEERAVLPPLLNRPRVYTYFDASTRRKDDDSKAAEHELLEIWRRAWWAQGFSPIVLGKAEAVNNPLFRRVEELSLAPELELEMMRWLAWSNMGTGIMCNWLAVPMGKYDDALLSFLRRGRFPELTRYAGLENGLFVGRRDGIDSAIKATIESPNATDAKSIYDAIPTEMFTVDTEHAGIAFYSTTAIGAKYPSIKQQLDQPETRSVGLAMLPALINSHLHSNWQGTYTSGIAVLQPITKNTSAMVEPAVQLARNLSQCSATPLPASCPPNLPNCRPCVSSQPMRILTPQVFKNSSTLFTIGTVPHPYTLQALIHSNAEMNLPFIRRKTSRDVWISAATKELLGTGISSFARLGPLKDAIASEYGTPRSYWLIAEDPPQQQKSEDLDELDWIFGFQIPRVPLSPLKSDNPVPSLDRHPPSQLEFEKQLPSAETFSKQRALLKSSIRLVQHGEKRSKDKAAARIRTIMEAWNLADTEAWKFVRAWDARRKLELHTWQNEEARYMGKGMYERFRDLVHG